MNEIVSALFGPVTTVIENVANALKNGAMQLLYEDPTAQVKVLSTFAKVGFTFIGISIAFGLVWLGVKLIKR